MYVRSSHERVILSYDVNNYVYNPRFKMQILLRVFAIEHAGIRRRHLVVNKIAKDSLTTPFHYMKNPICGHLICETPVRSS